MMLKTAIPDTRTTNTAVFVADPLVAKAIIAERRHTGLERFDEVWKGVYVVAPLPNTEHQRLVHGLLRLLGAIVDDTGVGEVMPGTNVSDREEGWTHNFRGPDVIVLLKGTKAKDCGTHFCGGPDFIVEILSEGDPAREKIPFYGQIGVRELLIVDRDPWALELLRLKGDKLEPVGRSTLEDPAWLASDVIPLRLRLQPGEERPIIEATPADGSWNKRI